MDTDLTTSGLTVAQALAQIESQVSSNEVPKSDTLDIAGWCLDGGLRSNREHLGTLLELRVADPRQSRTVGDTVEMSFKVEPATSDSQLLCCIEWLTRSNSGCIVCNSHRPS